MGFVSFLVAGSTWPLIQEGSNKISASVHEEKVYLELIRK
jgi:hypothetical protein